jgi:murein DD-endopeptidase MepM/ murein hydrolase activator NlpD
MYKFALILISSLLCACSTVRGDQPQLGMRFQQPYSSFVNGGTHAGLDIDVPLGTAVRSPADGIVIIAQTFNIRGIPTNTVSIQHNNGLTSRYLHIDKISVNPGDKIKKNQQFAVTALNGPRGPNTTLTVGYPHLHMELYEYGQKIDPMSLGMTCKEGAWVWPVGC